MGTRLEAKLDRDWVPHYICSKQPDWFTIWMNYEIIAPLGGTCWADNLKLNYDEESGLNSNTDGVDIRTECFGETDCIGKFRLFGRFCPVEKLAKCYRMARSPPSDTRRSIFSRFSPVFRAKWLHSQL